MKTFLKRECKYLIDYIHGFSWKPDFGVRKPKLHFWVGWDRSWVSAKLGLQKLQTLTKIGKRSFGVFLLLNDALRNYYGVAECFLRGV